MQIENEHIFRSALSDGINLFLGAGFSVLARDRSKRTMPVGSQLADELTELFSLPNGLELPQIATILNASDKSGLRSFLDSRFAVDYCDPFTIIWKSVMSERSSRRI